MEKKWHFYYRHDAFYSIKRYTPKNDILPLPTRRALVNRIVFNDKPSAGIKAIADYSCLWMHTDERQTRKQFLKLLGEKVTFLWGDPLRITGEIEKVTRFYVHLRLADNVNARLSFKYVHRNSVRRLKRQGRQ